jgi:hypothetical protein
MTRQSALDEMTDDQWAGLTPEERQRLMEAEYVRNEAWGKAWFAEMTVAGIGDVDPWGPMDEETAALVDLCRERASYTCMLMFDEPQGRG